jgi:hypothetical protein
MLSILVVENLGVEMNSRFSTVFVGVGLVAFALGFAAPIAEAKENARTICLARAGVTDQQWRNRLATYAQGAVMKQCMTEHGQNITVRKKDGSVLY